MEEQTTEELITVKVTDLNRLYEIIEEIAVQRDDALYDMEILSTPKPINLDELELRLNGKPVDNSVKLDSLLNGVNDDN